MKNYKAKNNYTVSIEEDGADIWVKVDTGLFHPYTCIVGDTDNKQTDEDRINTALLFFYPASYVSEYTDNNYSAEAVLNIAKIAYEIESALKEAVNFFRE